MFWQTMAAMELFGTHFFLNVCAMKKHSVHIMRKIPYSYYIAKMKRISTLEQDFLPNDLAAEQVRVFLFLGTRILTPVPRNRCEYSWS